MLQANHSEKCGHEVSPGGGNPRKFERQDRDDVEETADILQSNGRYVSIVCQDNYLMMNFHNTRPGKILRRQR